MNDAFFIDKEGTPWYLHITFGDIMRVKKHVLGVDGKPLDLCLIAESGDFRQVTDHIGVVVQCVYWLLEDSIRERTDHYGSFTMDWFYSRIDGEVLPNLIKAWYEALVNFSPFPVVKAAMITAGNIKTQGELMKAIEILAGQLETCMNTPGFSELTHVDIATENS